MIGETLDCLFFSSSTSSSSSSTLGRALTVVAETRSDKVTHWHLAPPRTMPSFSSFRHATFVGARVGDVDEHGHGRGVLPRPSGCPRGCFRLRAGPSCAPLHRHLVLTSHAMSSAAEGVPGPAPPLRHRPSVQAVPLLPPRPTSGPFQPLWDVCQPSQQRRVHASSFISVGLAVPPHGLAGVRLHGAPRPRPLGRVARAPAPARHRPRGTTHTVSSLAHPGGCL